MSRLASATTMLLSLVLLAATPGCIRPPFVAARATRHYPVQLQSGRSVDIHVFREVETLVIVNSTAHSYAEFDVWVNQRYMHHVKAMPAGATIRLSLWDFYDVRGEVFNAGGFWRTEAAELLRLVQIQTGSDDPLIGLITIRAERG